MEKKHEVHNLIILDESGSMNSIKNHVISGLNEIVQTIKGIEKKFPEQEHYITFLTFNGFGIKQLHFADRAREVKKSTVRRTIPKRIPRYTMPWDTPSPN